MAPISGQYRATAVTYNDKDIVEILPTNVNGGLNVNAIGGTVAAAADQYGFIVENTPMGESRSVSPFRLVGATFNGTTVDPNFWTVGTGSGGSAIAGNAQLIIYTGTASVGTTTVTSNRVARYIGGASNRYRVVVRLPDTGVTGCIRQWGANNATDGAYFQLSGTTFSVNTLKTGTATTVNNGSFNGNLGSAITLGTTVKTFEIYWTNSKVYFIYADSLLHTVSASTTTWADTMDLPVRAQIANTGTVISNNQMNVRVMTIARLGEAETQPISAYIAGTTGGTVLKYGAGNLHGLSVSGIATGAVVTIYDNVVGSAPILYSTGALTLGAQANNFPIDINTHSVPFKTGITVAITAASANAFVSYE